MASYDDVMTLADAASKSGDRAQISAALDAVENYFNDHAPKANDGDNGDMTDAQILQLGDAQLALKNGQNVTYSSSLWAGIKGGYQAAESQAALLASGNVAAAAKNTFNAGKELAKDIQPGVNTSGPDLDPIAAHFKKYKLWYMAAATLFALATVASIARSARDLDPLA